MFVCRSSGPRAARAKVLPAPGFEEGSGALSRPVLQRYSIAYLNYLAHLDSRASESPETNIFNEGSAASQ